MKTRPEKAILYQTLVLIIVKLISFPLILVATLQFVEPTPNSIFYPLLFIDVSRRPNCCKGCTVFRFFHEVLRQ
ncbi:unnamed protein product [Caenorhabditis angaria]|uniref:Uncharacterized protein n=1 Tax=Caenorhabditis angaria TaxID=860376 RepID=A0A9P1N416_9PELO|nr:unnamed protein product [Caenorhabditis angaria]